MCLSERSIFDVIKFTTC